MKATVPTTRDATNPEPGAYPIITQEKLPSKKISFTKEEIEELKQIHQKHTGELLSNEEAIAMGTRLITLFSIIAKPIPC